MTKRKQKLFTAMASWFRSLKYLLSACAISAGLFGVASAHLEHSTHNYSTLSALKLDEMAKLEKSAHKIYFSQEEDGIRLFRILNSRMLASDWAKKYHIVELSPALVSQYKTAGYRVEKADSYIKQKQAEFAKQAPIKSSQKSIPGYLCYETVEETFTEATTLAAAYPNHVQWIDIGDSYQKVATGQGYDLMVMVITDQRVSGPKPKLFIHSAMHAREYATAPLTLRFAKHLLSEMATDPDIEFLVRTSETHILFHMNPDGRKRAESGILWRKNTNSSYCSNIANSVGVDLNRNFNFKWNTVPNGSSGDECSSIYRGPVASSEPETQAVEAYMRSLFSDVRGELDGDAADPDAMGMHIDVHSYGGFVLWPWGDTSEPSPNDLALENLGTKLSRFNGYRGIQSADFYPTDGTSDGGSYGDLGIPHYTFEVGNAFFQDCNTFESQIVPGNIPAFVYALRVARLPYQMPFGPDIVATSFNGQAAKQIQTNTNFELGVAVASNLGSVQEVGLQKIHFSVNTPLWLANDAQEIASTERFTTIPFNISDFSEGDHIVYLQAENQDNQRGPIYAVKVNHAENAVVDIPGEQPAASNNSGGSFNQVLIYMLLLLALVSRRRYPLN